MDFEDKSTGWTRPPCQKRVCERRPPPSTPDYIPSGLPNLLDFEMILISLRNLSIDNLRVWQRLYWTRQIGL